MKKIKIITGPTASGKTKMAIETARKAGGILINADSRQIYKKLYIGTNVAPFQNSGRVWRVDSNLLSLELRKMLVEITLDGFVELPIYSFEGVDILLIGFLDLDKVFNAFAFKELCETLLREIILTDSEPVLVGGTGLYLEALIKGFDASQVEVDQKMRSELESLSLSELQKRLESISLETFQSLNSSDRNNNYRIIRIIERLSTNQKVSKKNPEFEFEILQPDYEWEELKKKIDLRVDEMFREGLLDEVSSILKSDQEARNYFVFQGVGYREVIQYLDGEISMETCKQLIKAGHRQYARRQRTWWRRYEQR